MADVPADVPASVYAAANVKGNNSATIVGQTQRSADGKIPPMYFGARQGDTPKILSTQVAGKGADFGNVRMSDQVTRVELDAKLETIEAKVEGRLARIDDRLTSISTQISEQRNTAWKAAGVVIATFIAGFALFVASFDSGRETATVAAEARADTKQALQEMREVLREFKSSLPAPPASPAAAAPRR